MSRHQFATAWDKNHFRPGLMGVYECEKGLEGDTFSSIKRNVAFIAIISFYT